MNTTLHSFIDFAGDTDFFSIEAEKDQIVQITVKTENASDLDALLLVYDSDGKLFAKNDDYLPLGWQNRGRMDARAGGSIPSDVIYWITVSNVVAPDLNSPFAGINYSYTPSIEENIDDDAEFASGEKADVAFDDPVDGIINTGDDADCFRFTATMEKDIRLDGLLQLYNTNGNLLAESDNHELPVLYPLDPPLNYIIPEDGIYYAVVTSVYMERGIEHTYTLTLSNTEIPNDERDDLQ